MKIYLAGPFWKEQERRNIEQGRDILRSKGYDVFVPMEHKIENGENLPNDVWGKAVFEMDKKAICECDIVVAMYYGLYSDSGTAWEIGYASCLNKKIVIVHCDKSQESSLMMVNDVINIDLSELKKIDLSNLKKETLFVSPLQK